MKNVNVQKIIASVVVLMCGVSAIIFWMSTPKKEKYAEIVMGTVCEVTVIDSSKKVRHEALDNAFRMLFRLDDMMSIFKPDSELSLLNERGSEEQMHVSDDLFFVVEQSRVFSLLTGSAFDITMLPLSRLWGFTSGEKQVPSDEAIQKAREYVGYQNINLYDNKEGVKTISFAKKGVAIDLGGVAKGYACDVMVTALKKSGITRAMVNIGGTVYAFGTSSHNRPWSIGIRDPRDKKKILRSILLDKSAVSTSGDYEQYFEYEGKRYTHILDPHTGYPAHGVLSVTVRAPSAMVADALSTACFILGPTEGKDLIERLEGVEAYFVVLDGDTYREISTTGF